MKPFLRSCFSADRRLLLAGVGAVVAVAGTARAAGQDPSSATRAVIAAMRARARPAVVLEQAEGPTVCRLGGYPRLPAASDWPDRKGRPLSFIAELDLAALRAAGGPDWLPASGALHLFFDVEDEPWGFDPADRDGWKVIMTSAASPRPLPRPPGLSGDRVFASIALAGRLAQTYPTTERLDLPPDVGRTFEFEPVQDFMDSGLGDGPRHQVSGYPSPIQGDGMELEAQLASNGIYVGGPEGYSDERVAALEAGAGDWRLLLQIDSDDAAGMMWSDSGTLYVWVREQDARLGDFSGVWIVLQSA
ncbi:MAG: YwqG family protein [Pseudomonadota bacterium]|nr:YwqG family protein [Pseudomonadota bacterium]